MHEHMLSSKLKDDSHPPRISSALPEIPNFNIYINELIEDF